MAKNDKSRRQKLQKLANKSSDRESFDVTKVEANFIGLVTQKKGALPEKAYMALKYYQPDHECFSDWTPDELKAFSEFSRKLSDKTWQDVFKTGGRVGNKTGLGYTPHKDRSKLPDCPAIDEISEDITFFELRVSGKARVHGFRSISTFFLVWLDRNHQIYPM